MIYISKAGLAVVNTSLRSKNKRYSLRLQQCKAEIVPESGSQRRKVTRASSTGFFKPSAGNHAAPCEKQDKTVA
ncbi:hypothetical protein [Bacteroides congonensis]